MVLRQGGFTCVGVRHNDPEQALNDNSAVFERFCQSYRGSRRGV